MATGGQTPEELETLLEDALLLQDARAIALLFEDGSVLVTSQGSPPVRGPEEILRAGSLPWQHQGGYLADPRWIVRARDTALILGGGVINVARRGRDRSWRYAILVLDNGGGCPPCFPGRSRPTRATENKR